VGHAFVFDPTELWPARAAEEKLLNDERQFARRLERGEEILCPRCVYVIGPVQQWDLGHDDIDPRIERPEHRECKRPAPNRLITSREW
jgi:hypothetical protein